MHPPYGKCLECPQDTDGLPILTGCDRIHLEPYLYDGIVILVVEVPIDMPLPRYGVSILVGDGGRGIVSGRAFHRHIVLEVTRGWFITHAEIQRGAGRYPRSFTDRDVLDVVEHRIPSTSRRVNCPIHTFRGLEIVLKFLEVVLPDIRGINVVVPIRIVVYLQGYTVLVNEWCPVCGIAPNISSRLIPRLIVGFRGCCN